MGIAFDARPGERYLGFGERSNAVDQRGREVESYVAEGAVRGGRAGARAGRSCRAWGFRPRDDATYFPMPWLLSTAGYGVLVDNAETSLLPRSASRRRGAWSVEVDARRAAPARVRGARAPADVAARA